MSTENIIKRRQLVVDPELQYGLVVKFAVIVTIILISSLVLLTYMYNDYISTVVPISLGAGGITSFEVAHLVNLSDLLWPLMLVIFLSVCISSAAVYIFGVRFTHKMAGPVYRLSNNIAEMTEGHLGQKVSFRKKDNFQYLAADIDRLRLHWNNSVAKLKKINDQLNDISNEEQKELLSQSGKILSDLLRTVS